ncbi:MAG: hypothetical protein U0136_04925 [Bdellovibrionota bacterium]
MGRIHFIELEDLPWFPAAIRDASTDYLRAMLRAIRGYEAAIPLLAAALEQSGRKQIVDLCSGGAGPWPDLLPILKNEVGEVSVCLTDKYPNISAYESLRDRLNGSAPKFERRSVDARSVPRSLKGFRTMFTALHHFRPEEVEAIFQDAIDAGEPIAAFEVTERTVGAVLKTLATPLLVFLLTPFIRPFQWSRLFWTYIIPAVPLLAVFDGIVSGFRSYSPSEIESLVKQLDGTHYNWKIGKLPGLAMPMTYVIGTPRETAESRPGELRRDAA